MDISRTGVPARRRTVSGNFEESGKETKGAAGSAEKRPDQAIYDARGNGDGMTAPTLTGDHQNRGTDYTTICIQGNCVDQSNSAGCNGKGWKKDTSYTLNKVDRHAVMCMAHGQANAEILRNLSPTLNCDHEQPIVFGNNGYAEYKKGIGTIKSSGGDCGYGSENLCVSCLTGWDRQARRVYRDQGIMPALSAWEGSGQNQQAVLTKGTVAGFNGHKSITGSIQYREDTAPTLESNMPGNVLKGMIVRRLTPLECERLQGFPDGWTDIGDYIDSKGRRKHTSDTARYRALGNSIALPPWRWVLKRLCNQYDSCVTMGSLFDGIGGFPLIWEKINGKGNCLWASEIEEFPIAVTKIRIGG